MPRWGFHHRRCFKRTALLACQTEEFSEPCATFMSAQQAPSPTRWPFIVADTALLAAAFWIVNHYPHPLPVTALALAVGCVVLAAWLAVMPFRMHYQTLVRFAEAGELNDAVNQINQVEAVADQIQNATAQWQGVQEQSTRAVTAAREISERIEAEAKAFAGFMQNANDQEKATLRLEVEKLRRVEGHWLQVLVHLLDHVYALQQAGARSGQPNLEAQLGRFREACYDVVRRVGLLPFEAASGDGFDPEKHQVVDGKTEPEMGSLIGPTLAAGYSFQGQMVRRCLVSIESAVPAVPPVGETVLAEEPVSESAGDDLAEETPAATEATEPSADAGTAESPEVAGNPPKERPSAESFRLES